MNISKLQRWSYARLMKRVKETSEVGGVHCLMVSPQYTSQTCSVCGYVHKTNRNGEIFLCRKCGYLEDADCNASKNILNLGTSRQSMVAGQKAG